MFQDYGHSIKGLEMNGMKSGGSKTVELLCSMKNDKLFHLSLIMALLSITTNIQSPRVGKYPIP